MYYFNIVRIVKYKEPREQLKLLYTLQYQYTDLPLVSFCIPDQPIPRISSSKTPRTSLNRSANSPIKILVACVASIKLQLVRFLVAGVKNTVWKPHFMRLVCRLQFCVPEFGSKFFDKYTFEMVSVGEYPS